ncbi:MAG: H-NS histone family protein [Pseudomonadota bacterium]
MAKLEKMSKAALEKERADAEARLKEISKAQAEFDGRRIKELRAEIEAKLAKEGYSLDDLLGGKAKKRGGGGARGKAPAKYRHPENAAMTWSGRGRQPAWYKDALAAGKKPADLEI